MSAAQVFHSLRRCHLQLEISNFERFDQDCILGGLELGVVDSISVNLRLLYLTYVDRLAKKFLILLPFVFSLPFPSCFVLPYMDLITVGVQRDLSFPSIMQIS